MSTRIEELVRDKYGAVAASTLTGDDAGVGAVARAFGYSAAELASIPAAANMGLSCGNPTATANLAPGETVVDLGCGGGLDVFLAAKKVGPTGRAIGIDMTQEMLARARANAASGGYRNVEFHEARIDALPLADASADCVISNCVVNLAPDKPAVFREIFRVLKPGGRVAISDIALKRPLPPELGADLMAYVGCIAGAIAIADYEHGLRAAGFSAVQVVDTKKDLNAYAAIEGQSGCCSPAPAASSVPQASGGCCSPAPAASSVPQASSGCCGGGAPSPDEALHARLADLLARYDVNAYAASVQVYAIKPGRR